MNEAGKQTGTHSFGDFESPQEAADYLEDNDCEKAGMILSDKFTGQKFTYNEIGDTEWEEVEE